MKKIAETCDRLKGEAHWQFDMILDYIWKTPKFIETEMELEKEKLDTYFPPDGNAEVQKSRRLRWYFEELKLKYAFPNLMATGNLFATVSLFETFCILLCSETEKEFSSQLSDFPGNGIARAFAYLSDIGVKLEKVSVRQEVIAILKIRNCLFHASGLLSLSRDEKELRRLVATGEYIDARRRKYLGEKDFALVSIVQGDLGERVQINNMYAWTVCSYLRNHFCDLCDHVKECGMDEDSSNDEK